MQQLAELEEVLAYTRALGKRAGEGGGGGGWERERKGHGGGEEGGAGLQAGTGQEGR